MPIRSNMFGSSNPCKTFTTLHITGNIVLFWNTVQCKPTTKLSLQLWAKWGEGLVFIQGGNEYFPSSAIPLCTVVFSSEFVTSFSSYSLFSSSFSSLSPSLSSSSSPSLCSLSSLSFSLSNLVLDKEPWVDLDKNVGFRPHFFLFFALFALVVGGFKYLGVGGGEGVSKDARVWWFSSLFACVLPWFPCQCYCVSEMI